MRKTTLAILLALAALAASPALAQNAPVGPPISPQEQLTFFQKAIGVLQLQRNKAEDDAAQATAQAQSWKEQLDRALGEVKRLTDQLAAAKPAAPSSGGSGSDSAPQGEPKK